MPTDGWFDYGDLASAAEIGRDEMYDDQDDEIFPIGGRPGVAYGKEYRFNYCGSNMVTPLGVEDLKVLFGWEEDE